MLACVIDANKMGERVRCDGDNDDSYGKGSGGNSGDGSGTSALRCWRSNETGEREEVAPWERHRDDGLEGPTGAATNAERGRQSQSQRQVAGGYADENTSGTGDRRNLGGRYDHVAVGVTDKDDTISVPDKRGTRVRGAGEENGGFCSALASSPYNTRAGDGYGGGGGGGKGTGGGSGATPRRRVSSPDLSRRSRRNSGGGGGIEEREGEEGGSHSYTPSWIKRSVSSTEQRDPARRVAQTNHQRRRRENTEGRSPSSSEAAQRRGELSHTSLRVEEKLWNDRGDSEEQDRGDQWEGSDRGGIESHRGFLASLKAGNARQDDEDGGWGEVGKGKPKGQDASSHCSVVPDPDLLSSLKRGGSRNAK